MTQLILDTETYSESDITVEGGFKYTTDPSTELTCMSYKIDSERTKLWYARKDKDIPNDLYNAVMDCSLGQGKALAFNATFDMRVWNLIVAPTFNVPEIPLENWIDIQAVCARFKLPQNLKNAGVALGCLTEKMAVGKQLIRKCCKPGGNPTEQDYTDLCQYCIVDTDVLSEIKTRLPVWWLTKQEQKVWEMTYKMNDFGVPVDIKEADAIIKYLKIYMEGQVKILPELTKGFVSTPGQIAKIKQFCKNMGVELPNLAAETVTKYLAKDDLPEVVREVLQLRQELGKSSVKKFLTIHQMHNHGVVQGNLNYHGAGTGRWAGRGLQYHNLPRAKLRNPEEVIQQFIDRDFIKDPVGKAKAIIRPMIKAPEGHSLIVSDYSSIENRVLAWLAGDEQTLEGFRNNFDQYKDMASFLFKVPVEEIDKTQRQLGKALILGCGFGMSANRFMTAAQTYGVFVDKIRAKFAVDAYRKKYRLIVKMWYKLADAVKFAVKYPGKKFETNKCTCIVLTDHVKHKWLRIVLPSGRALMYMNPKTGLGKFGPATFYKGVHPKTYQWVSKELTPGLLAENVTQAAARDVLCEGMLTVQQSMPEVKLVLCVHDEAGALIKDTDIRSNTMREFNFHLCVDQAYRHDLPLAAEGYIEKRYKKD